MFRSVSMSLDPGKVAFDLSQIMVVQGICGLHFIGPCCLMCVASFTVTVIELCWIYHEYML